MSWENIRSRFLLCLMLVLAGTMLAGQLSAQTTGLVFVNGNSASNAVWMYKRAANGMLSLVGNFSTQGSGGTQLSSQGSVALANNNKLLYAVNEASNDITAFQVTPTGLTFISRTASGGTFPNSVAAYGNLLYVLNAQGTTPNITAFRIQTNGSLRMIPNSSRTLTSSLRPAQVGFSPDGKTLVVVEIDGNNIDTYAVGTDGRATGPFPQGSAGPGPFGFAFDNKGRLLVSEESVSSTSSYSLSGTTLNVISGEVVDFGRAACWLVNTNNPNYPQQYSYVTNTGSDTLSGYAIAANGSISLLNADGLTAVFPAGSFPIDMAISRDSKYLYVLQQRLPGISVLQIHRDGSLTQIQVAGGTPTTSYGMTGY